MLQTIYIKVSYEYKKYPCNVENLKTLLNNTEDMHRPPDIIPMCKTWLRDENHDLYNLSGYNLTDVHRKKKKGGGVAMYISGDLTSNFRNDRSVFEEGILESLFFIDLATTNVAKPYIIGDICKIPGTSGK